MEKTMDMIRKALSIEEKAFDDAEQSLVALVSTPDVDRDKEAILTGGWDFKNFLKNPVVLLGHDYSTMPIGRAMWIKKTADGVKAKVQFANSQVGEEVYGLFKGGFMNAFSVGFRSLESVFGDEADKLIKGAERVYTKTELLEFSAVAVPSNQNAVALRGIKSECLIKMLNIKSEESEDDTRGQGQDDTIVEDKPSGDIQEDIPVDDKDKEEPKPDKEQPKDEPEKPIEPIDENREEDEVDGLVEDAEEIMEAVDEIVETELANKLRHLKREVK